MILSLYATLSFCGPFWFSSRGVTNFAILGGSSQCNKYKCIQMYCMPILNHLPSWLKKLRFCQTQRLTLPLLSHGALCLGDGLRSDLWGCGLAARDFCVVTCCAFRMCCPSGMCLKTGSENHPLPQKILAHLLSKKSFSAQKDLFLAKIRMEFSKFTTSILPLDWQMN